MSEVHTLAIDVGGTGLKASVLDPDGKMLHAKVWHRTPVDPSPRQMVDQLKLLVAPLPPYDRVSIGFPGAVRRGRVLTAPHFANPKWMGFALADVVAAELGKPVRLGNDADIQGLGVVAGQGVEAVLTLGTGAGTAFFEDGILAPHMEFAHHPVHGKHDYNGYVGRDAFAKVGLKRWNRRVHKVIAILDALLHFDRLYIGGGNGNKVDGKLGDRVTIVPNEAGITGGVKLWREAGQPGEGGGPGTRSVDPDHPVIELVRSHD